jgi:uncharacterized protein
MTTGTTLQTIDLLVTGVAGVGKTTFIKTISQHTDHTHSDGWFTGHVQIDDGLDALFMEPPASINFDFMWQREMIESAEVHAYIVVCDSARPEHFGEMIGILETIRAFHPGTPVIVAANKQDHPAAWSVDDIRMGLGIPADIPVMPCVAKDVDGVSTIVIRLLEALWQ